MADDGHLVLGKVVLGRVYDRFGMKTGTIMLFSLTDALGACAVLLPREPPLLPLAHGLCPRLRLCQRRPHHAAPLHDRPPAGPARSIRRIYGVCQVFDRLGVSLGMPVTAAIRDVTGSYIPAFVAVSVCSLLVLVLMLAAIRTSPAEIAKFDALNNAPAPANE